MAKNFKVVQVSDNALFFETVIKNFVEGYYGDATDWSPVSASVERATDKACYVSVQVLNPKPEMEVVENNLSVYHFKFWCPSKFVKNRKDFVTIPFWFFKAKIQEALN